jgi:hypothetical protein
LSIFDGVSAIHDRGVEFEVDPEVRKEKMGRKKWRFNGRGVEFFHFIV